MQIMIFSLITELEEKKKNPNKTKTVPKHSLSVLISLATKSVVNKWHFVEQKFDLHSTLKNN